MNHTFAEMNPTDPNPFVLMHKRDALRAYALTMDGKTAWPASEIKVTVDPAELAKTNKKA